MMSIALLKNSTVKPRYSEQVRQTLFVHYIKYFTISNVICLVNPQNGSWILFTISRNSLFQGSLYRGLSVLFYLLNCVILQKCSGKKKSLLPVHWLQFCKLGFQRF